MQSEELIQALSETTKKISAQIERFKNFDLDTLQWRESPTAWSILECLEHLNLYGNYYLPAIEIQLERATTESEIKFRSGILGKYFSKMMLPKEKLNKMKTFQDKNPINHKLDKDVINEFLKQQDDLMKLLTLSRKASLNKIKIKTSISNFISLNLGDTFQFFINHNLRHLEQANRILSSCERASR